MTIPKVCKEAGLLFGVRIMGKLGVMGFAYV